MTHDRSVNMEIQMESGDVRMNMEYWKQFENTGRIEDYLSYVSVESRDAGYRDSARGEEVHAGIYHGDRNHIEAVARGGVRQTYQHSD